MPTVTRQPSGPWVPPAYVRKEHREAYPASGGPSGLVSSNPVPSIPQPPHPEPPQAAVPPIREAVEAPTPPVQPEEEAAPSVIQSPDQDPIFQETEDPVPSWEEQGDPRRSSPVGQSPPHHIPRDAASVHSQRPSTWGFGPIRQMPVPLQRDTTLILLLLVLVLEEPERNESLLFALCYLLL